MTDKGAGPFKAVPDQGMMAVLVIDAAGEPFVNVDPEDCAGGDLSAAKARATRIAEALNRSEAHLHGASVGPDAGRDGVGKDSIDGQGQTLLPCQVSDAMIEAVARAIWSAAKAEADTLGKNEIPDAGFDDMQPDEQDFARRMAQAAITTMNTASTIPTDEEGIERNIGRRLAREKLQPLTDLANLDRLSTIPSAGELRTALREAIQLLDDCEIAHPLRWDNVLASKSCTMGVGCDEAGACWAAAQGRPERCPRDDPEEAAWAWLTNYSRKRYNEEPEDCTFSADQVVDAFMAGQDAALSIQTISGKGMREALTEARAAIASLDVEALGMVRQHPSADRDNGYEYPIRDELLAKIDAALVDQGERETPSDLPLDGQ